MIPGINKQLVSHDINVTSLLSQYHPVPTFPGSSNQFVSVSHHRSIDIHRSTHHFTIGIPCHGHPLAPPGAPCCGLHGAGAAQHAGGAAEQLDGAARGGGAAAHSAAVLCGRPTGKAERVTSRRICRTEVTRNLDEDGDEDEDDDINIMMMMMMMTMTTTMMIAY